MTPIHRPKNPVDLQAHDRENVGPYLLFNYDILRGIVQQRDLKSLRWQKLIL